MFVACATSNHKLVCGKQPLAYRLAEMVVEIQNKSHTEFSFFHMSNGIMDQTRLWKYMHTVYVYQFSGSPPGKVSPDVLGLVYYSCTNITIHH